MLLCLPCLQVQHSHTDAVVEGSQSVDSVEKALPEQKSFSSISPEGRHTPLYERSSPINPRQAGSPNHIEAPFFNASSTSSSSENDESSGTTAKWVELSMSSLMVCRFISGYTDCLRSAAVGEDKGEGSCKLVCALFSQDQWTWPRNTVNLLLAAFGSFMWICRNWVEQQREPSIERACIGDSYHIKTDTSSSQGRVGLQLLKNLLYQSGCHLDPQMGLGLEGQGYSWG